MKMRITASVVTYSFATLLAGAAAAQQQNPEIVAVAKGDSVRLFLLAPPPVYNGFNVYGGVQGTTLTKLSSAPVVPLTDPSAFLASIGSDLQDVMRRTETADEISLMRRLRSDDLTAAIMSVLYPGVAVALGRSWTVGGNTPGAEYSYRIEYVNASGEPTGRSANARVRMVDLVPATPRDAKADASSARVKLSWSYPKQGNNLSDLAFGFNVYRAETATGEAQKLNVSPLLRDDVRDPEYLDESIRTGVTYRYTVRAVDIVGRESAPTPVLTVPIVDDKAPLPPPRLTAVEGDGMVTLVWAMSPEIDAASYNIERSYGLDKPFTQINTKPIPIDVPSYTDSTATGGVQTFYRIIVLDRSGNRSKPGNPMSTLPHDRTPPTAPLAFAAVVQPMHRMRLSWSPPATRDAIGYYVYRNEGSNAATRITFSPLDALTMIDVGVDSAGLEPGKRYRYAVTAIDASFNESATASLEIAMPDDEPPEPPVALHAENVLARHVAITWSGSPSLDAMTYELDKQDASGRRTILGKFAATAQPALRDTMIVIGQRYIYRLTAIDTAGNRSTPTVDTLWFRDLTPPPAPRNAYARASAAGSVITWERVIEQDLAGYMVYKSDIPTGVFVAVTAQPVTELTWTDRGASPGVYYIVRAVDTSGNTSSASPPVRVIQQ